MCLISTLRSFLLPEWHVCFLFYFLRKLCNCDWLLGLSEYAVLFGVSVQFHVVQLKRRVCVKNYALLTSSIMICSEKPQCSCALVVEWGLIPFPLKAECAVQPLVLLIADH